MCLCKNVDFGSYDNAILIKIPKDNHTMSQYIKNRVKAGLSGKGICVDRCLVDEIQSLWKVGIRTNGCCCGHNKQDGYIGVFEQDVDKMKELGYKNLEWHDTLYHFYPKTDGCLHEFLDSFNKKQ